MDFHNLEHFLTVTMLIVSVAAVLFNYFYHQKASIERIDFSDKTILGRLDQMENVLKDLTLKVVYIESYLKNKEGGLK